MRWTFSRGRSFAGSDCLHWHASCVGGFLLKGRYRPICSIVHTAPECRARRAFRQATNRMFREPDHTLRMHAIWLLCDMLSRASRA